jgi:hypothetical protein
MRLLIPRTQAHLRRAVALARNASIGGDASDAYVSILGVYPLVPNANCAGQAMSSANGACQWDASDGGNYFLHNRTDFAQPDGDTCPTCSMIYSSFDASGDVTNLNDQNHTASDRWICSTNDK